MCHKSLPQWFVHYQVISLMLMHNKHKNISWKSEFWFNEGNYCKNNFTIHCTLTLSSCHSFQLRFLYLVFPHWSFQIYTLSRLSTLLKLPPLFSNFLFVPFFYTLDILIPNLTEIRYFKCMLCSVVKTRNEVAIMSV